MGDFAEHLIEQEAVAPEQLERALQAQRLYGGRLGTNLVETGALDATELTARLSAFQGVPPPPPSWLADRCPEAEHVLPLELLRRHRVLPLRIENRTLHVATLDPKDAELREALAGASRLEVRTWVLPELRLHSLLLKRYGIRPERSVSLAQLAEQARRRRESRAPVEHKPDPAQREREQRQALGIAPLEAGEELVGESFFSDLHARHLPGQEGASSATAPDDSLFEPIEPSPGASLESPDPHGVDLQAAEDSGPSRAPESLAALEARLAEVADRQSLVATVLEIASRWCPTAALLVLDDGMLTGEQARVDGRSVNLDGILVPCDPGSHLVRPLATGEPFRGPLPSHAVDQRLVRALGRSEAETVATLPIRLDDLGVALLYADGGDRPLAETSFAALRALCELASRSWERIALGDWNETPAVVSSKAPSSARSFGR